MEIIMLQLFKGQITASLLDPLVAMLVKKILFAYSPKHTRPICEWS